MKSYDARGYYQLRIKIYRKYKGLAWHNFVYEYFHGIMPTAMQIDHINAIQADNRLNNLQLL